MMVVNAGPQLAHRDTFGIAACRHWDWTRHVWAVNCRIRREYADS